MLIYQNQDCELTLKEGIKIYENYLIENNKVPLKELNKESTLIRDHDSTHVVFGLDTSLEEESLLDTWLAFGCSYTFSYLASYAKLPEIKELTKKIYKEVGLIGFLKLYKNLLPIKLKIIFKNTRKMKKKWPFKHPDDFLDRKISDLREEFGIQILSSQERRVKKILWSGSHQT
jgi:hypothetical protein